MIAHSGRARIERRMQNGAELGRQRVIECLSELEPFGEDGWVTVVELRRVCELSNTTVHARLDELEAGGRVERKRIGTRVLVRETA